MAVTTSQGDKDDQENETAVADSASLALYPAPEASIAAAAAGLGAPMGAVQCDGRASEELYVVKSESEECEVTALDYDKENQKDAARVVQATAAAQNAETNAEEATAEALQVGTKRPWKCCCSTAQIQRWPMRRKANKNGKKAEEPRGRAQEVGKERWVCSWCDEINESGRAQCHSCGCLTRSATIALTRQVGCAVEYSDFFDGPDDSASDDIDHLTQRPVYYYDAAAEALIDQIAALTDKFESYSMEKDEGHFLQWGLELSQLERASRQFSDYYDLEDLMEEARSDFERLKKQVKGRRKR
jgi:hypothetical protein